MSVDAIAYGPDEACLLTIDGPDLLAYDATTEAPKWSLGIGRRAAAVLFLDPQLFPASAASPWRAQSIARAALVVDVEGRLHLVDTMLGRAMGELGPFGKPLAVASSMAGGALALAVETQVAVWRAGEQHHIPMQHARGLAFSNDGATLAIGNDKGELRMFQLATGRPPEEILRSSVRGAISDLVQHPNGSWVVASAQGVSLVSASGTSRLEKLPAGARRLRFDGRGGRLALQSSERGIVVYEWPTLSVLMRVQYMERPVCGFSFGPDNWLGVALDHGDGNKIDVGTSEVHRTDTHPGRQHRSWTLLVEGKKELLSAKEAEDIRRMRDPFHIPAPPANSYKNNVGARIGIGAMISIALLSFRVCARVATPSSSSWSYNPSLINTPSLKASRCDRACAAERLRTLKVACEAPAAACAADANAAAKALEAGKCAEAKAAVARIDVQRMNNPEPLLDVNVLLARVGLDEACANGTIRPQAVKHAQVVRLKGSELAPSYEKLPETDPAHGEVARSVWAAPDGTVFVATTSPPAAPEKRCVVYRSSKPEVWRPVYRSSTWCADVFGRTASDVYLMTDDALVHFDGKAWEPVSLPHRDREVTALATSGPDLFLAHGDDSGTELYRRRGETWTKEQTPPDVRILRLYGGPSSTVWALGERSADDVLLQRSAGGTWAIKKPAIAEDTATISSVWVSPTGELFLSKQDGVLRSKNAGTTWTTDEPPYSVYDLWGRASNDVYGRTRVGLVHFDGKTWSAASFVGSSEAMTGTASELLLVRSTEDDEER